MAAPASPQKSIATNFSTPPLSAYSQSRSSFLAPHLSRHHLSARIRSGTPNLQLGVSAFAFPFSVFESHAPTKPQNRIALYPRGLEPYEITRHRKLGEPRASARNQTTHSVPGRSARIGPHRHAPGALSILRAGRRPKANRSTLKNNRGIESRRPWSAAGS